MGVRADRPAQDPTATPPDTDTRTHATTTTTTDIRTHTSVPGQRTTCPQRDFAVATCPTCGMMYGKGLAEEERLHDSFHNAHGAVFRFPVRAAPGRVGTRAGREGRC